MTREQEATYAISDTTKLAETATKAAWDLATSNIAFQLHALGSDAAVETRGYLETKYETALAMSHGKWITKEQAKKETIDTLITELAFYGGNSKRTRARIAELEKRRDEINKVTK